MTSSLSASSRAVIARNVVIAIALVALSMLADRWVADHVTFADVYERDWGRMLRTLGYLPFWLTGAIALLLTDRAASGTKWWRRGALLAAAPTAAGIVGEALKLLVRRERPGAPGGSYVFRAFADHPFSSRNIGFPSSHAVVAFGAAEILSRLFPRARIIWYLAAAGCAFTRILAHAHYLSDVVAAAAIGVGVVALCWRYVCPEATP